LCLPRPRTALVITLLPPPLLRHVQLVMGGEEGVISAGNWAGLRELLRSNPVSVAVIDPSSDGSRTTTEFERITSDYPSLPIIAYVPLTAAAFRAVAQLSHLGLEHVILYSHDDSSERMIALIDKVRSSPLTERVIEALRPRLERLPLAIGNAVREMFAEPHRYPSAQDIAVSANVSIVRLYRAFQSAELAPPRKMVVAARMLRGYVHLSDPGQSVRGVSAKLAYRNSRIFTEQTSEVFGLTPSRVRGFLSEDQVVTRLLSWVTP
jgi:AraC-type DNA-binding domain-containing proteins